jgi:hypothetical protein
MLELLEMLRAGTEANNSEAIQSLAKAAQANQEAIQQLTQSCERAAFFLMIMGFMFAACLLALVYDNWRLHKKVKNLENRLEGISSLE